MYRSSSNRPEYSNLINTRQPCLQGIGLSKAASTRNTIASSRLIRSSDHFLICHSCNRDDLPSIVICPSISNVQMYSLTGIVYDTNFLSELIKLFKDVKWDHENLNWNAPYRIDVPILSVKERLHLERHLPVIQKTGANLQNALGYKIDDSITSSKRKFKQYQEYYDYYPLFAKFSV